MRNRALRLHCPSFTKRFDEVTGSPSKAVWLDISTHHGNCRLLRAPRAATRRLNVACHVTLRLGVIHAMEE